MSNGEKIRLDLAVSLAQAVKSHFAPFCDKIMIAGSIRRECPLIGDIEIVCLPKCKEPVKTLFDSVPSKEPIDEFIEVASHLKITMGSPKGRMMKGSISTAKFDVNVDVFMPEPYDWGRILAIRTGSADYAMKVLASGWTKLGWCGTEHGWRRIKECQCDLQGVWHVQPNVKKPTMPPVFDTEESFFDFLNIKWVEPRERNL